MTLTLNLDPEAEDALRKAFGADLSRAALEAMLVAGYRSGSLSRYEVQKILGFQSRWQTEAWLKERRAYPDISLDDVIRDSDNSRAAREAACSSSQTPRP